MRSFKEAVRGYRRLPRYHIACLDPPPEGVGLQQAMRSNYVKLFELIFCHISLIF